MRVSFAKHLALAGLAWLALASCTGEIGLPPRAPKPATNGIVQGPPAVELSACNGTPSVAPVTARRMTRWEYDNTMRDLLVDTTHPASNFDAEEEVLGFNNNSDALVTSSAMVEKLMNASEDIAARASAGLSIIPWFSCTNAPLDDTCAASFIDAFGSRAFRRALAADERQGLLDLYQTGKTIGALGADGTELTPFDAGLQLVISAVLQSPDFLYRLEDAGGLSAKRVTGYEMASRLSYLLWGSMPDDTLLAAAGQGQLETPDQVLAQAQRMIDDPRARDAVVQFHQQWLDFDRIAKVGKATQIYPEWSTAIGDAMFEETSQFIEHVTFDGEGTWDALLSAQYSYLNPQLAAFYGVQATMGQGFVKTPLDAQHAGLLTQGTMMTINAHSDQTSPVHRGKLIREAYFCTPLPPPPAGIVIQVPPPAPNTTARQRFAQHSSDPACSGCHTLMDPVGFGFENFDGVGRFRTTENNQTIDSSGTIKGTDVAGNFQGAAGLAQRMLESSDARHCYVKQWFRFGYGRGEQNADACSVERLEKSFEAQGHGVKSLVLSLTGSDAFLYKAGAP